MTKISLEIKYLINSFTFSGSFARPDRGSILMNTLHYNATKPPSYDLSKVTTPVSLHYGPGDFVVTEEVIVFFYQLLVLNITSYISLVIFQCQLLSENSPSD